MAAVPNPAKRGPEFPREQLAAIAKRQRRHRKQAQHPHARALAAAPVRHGVPPHVMAIVAPPYKVSDFFAHVRELHPKQQAQLAHATQRLPPPLPPALPALVKDPPGTMVPFVFPPLPVVEPDEFESGHGGKEPVHVAALPLPFPPPNYMPYPLVALLAPMVPADVIGEWLDAATRLPRVDMVVASAAGSIHDFGTEACHAGLTAARLDELVRLRELDPEGGRSDYSRESDRELELGYAGWASQVDTSAALDPHRLSAAAPLELLLKLEFARVRPRVSERGRCETEPCAAAPEYSDRDLHDLGGAGRSGAARVLAPGRPVAGEGLEEARRLQLVELCIELETQAAERRTALYAARKRHLLARLGELQQSRLCFDDEQLHVANAELRAYVARRQAERDAALLRLRLATAYGKLQAALLFYQACNKAYRGLNGAVVSKLQKLRHFLEHQRRALAAALEPEALNVRLRDSASVYSNFVEYDYSARIKETFNAALDQKPAPDMARLHTVDPTAEHLGSVHDMMPLVTEEEFLLITGDAPRGPQKDPRARHHIFQSALYSRALELETSAENSLIFKRRPGRRAAPKSVYDVNQHSELALVTRIMKHFVGPAPTLDIDLAKDLDLMM